MTCYGLSGGWSGVGRNEMREARDETGKTELPQTPERQLQEGREDFGVRTFDFEAEGSYSTLCK